MTHSNTSWGPDLLPAVELQMLALCRGSSSSANASAGAVRYHLGAGGSRLRARLALDASLRLGLPNEDAVILAAVCELLHNASLVQDDLLDDEPSRRGQPSIWVAFDRTAAICCGDLMLASAYAGLAGISRPELLARLIRHTHARAVDVILGQSEEKASEAAAPATLAAYERIAIAKSAALLMLPLELPLILADATSALEKAQQTAESFAIAYQMVDDLDDIAQDHTNSSLNAVSVLINTGLTLSEASALVRNRAVELLDLAIEAGSRLPQNCAAVMLDHAAITIGRLAPDQQLCHAR